MRRDIEVTQLPFVPQPHPNTYGETVTVSLVEQSFQVVGAPRSDGISASSLEFRKVCRAANPLDFVRLTIFVQLELIVSLFEFNL